MSSLATKTSQLPEYERLGVPHVALPSPITYILPEESFTISSASSLLLPPKNVFHTRSPGVAKLAATSMSLFTIIVMGFIVPVISPDHEVKT